MLWSLFGLQVLRLHLRVVEKKLLDLVGEGGLGPLPLSSFHPFYSPSFALFLFSPNNTLRDLKIDCSIKCYVYVSLLFKKMDYHLIHVQKFNLPVDCMRVAFEGSYNDLKLLDNPSKVLKELGFFKNNRVFKSLKYFFQMKLHILQCMM